MFETWFPSSHLFRRGLFKSQRLYQAQSAPQIVLWKLMPHFYGATMAAKSVKTTFVQKCFLILFFSIFWEIEEEKMMKNGKICSKSVCKNFVADFIPKLESWELRMRKMNWIMMIHNYSDLLTWKTHSLSCIHWDWIDHWIFNYCILTAHRELLPLWYPHRQCHQCLHPHLLHLRRSFVRLRL